MFSSTTAAIIMAKPKRLKRKLFSLLATAAITLPHQVDANFGVIMTQMDGQTRYLPSVSAAFGPSLPILGISGVIYPMQHDGCDLDKTVGDLSEFRRSPVYLESIIKDIVVLIARGNCSFDTKIHNAQLGRQVSTVIIHQEIGDINNNTDIYTDFPRDINSYVGLLRMTGSKFINHIKVPSIFVSFDAGWRLRDSSTQLIIKERQSLLPVYLYALGSGEDIYHDGGEDEDEYGDYYSSGWSAVKDHSSSSSSSSWSSADYQDQSSSNGRRRVRRLYDVFFLSDLIMMFMVGVTTTSLCGILTVGALVLARYRLYRNRTLWEQRNRMTNDELQLLKQRQVQPGDLCIDSGEHCAICLDEFIVEDTIRELPCRHLFHSSCIDSWLLQRHRSCPTCRQEAAPRKSTGTNTTTSAIISIVSSSSNSSSTPRAAGSSGQQVDNISITAPGRLPSSLRREPQVLASANQNDIESSQSEGEKSVYSKSSAQPASSTPSSSSLATSAGNEDRQRLTISSSDPNLLL